MADIQKRNKERTAAFWKLWHHRNLGWLLSAGIIFLFLGIWKAVFVTYFWFCFELWYDMVGYKFLGCQPKPEPVFNPFTDNYEERNVVNMMAYKTQNAIVSFLMLLLTSALMILWHGWQDTVQYVFNCIFLIYLGGTKEVGFYWKLNDTRFFSSKNVYWYGYTYYGTWKRIFGGEKDSDGNVIIDPRSVTRQAYIALGLSIIVSIIWSVSRRNFI